MNRVKQLFSENTPRVFYLDHERPVPFYLPYAGVGLLDFTDGNAKIFEYLSDPVSKKTSG